MPHEGGEVYQSALDVHAIAIPAQEAVDGKGMAEVVKTWSALSSPLLEADLGKELVERFTQGGCRYRTPPQGGEEGIFFPEWLQDRFASVEVPQQAATHPGTKGNQAALVEFGLANEQRAPIQVDISQAALVSFTAVAVRQKPYTGRSWSSVGSVG